MEMQNILMLIQAFTDHSLTELNVEDGGVKVCLKRDRGAAVSGLTTSAVPAVGNVPEISNGRQMAVAAGAGVGIAPVVPVAGTAAGAGIVGNGVVGAAMPGAASVGSGVVGTAVPGTVSVGGGAAVAVPGAVSVGNGAAAAIPGAVSVGSGAIAAVPGAVSVGSGAIAAVPGAVSVGSGTAAAVIPGGGIAAAGIQTVTAAADTEGIPSDNVVVSPLVGIFYSASSPEAEAFVKVGDRVKKGQVLGIIEAMKLMNEIESEYDGVVEAILVKNEEVVEYGQPLFRIL